MRMSKAQVVTMIVLCVVLCLGGGYAVGNSSPVERLIGMERLLYGGPQV